MEVISREVTEFFNWFVNVASPLNQLTVMTSFLTLLGFIIWGIAKFIAWKSDKSKTKPQSGMFEITLDEYENRIAEKIHIAETKLQGAHETEKQTFLAQITELKRRAADPEAALEEARKTITKLEAAITREGNETDISQTQWDNARKALEAGDFSIADELFAQIEAREDMAVKRAARAVFARGEIAEQEIRWQDAVSLFEKAANLDPTFYSLEKAAKLNWQMGRYENAIYFVNKMADQAENDEQRSFALNSHALLLAAQGKYDLAEPLYRQAIEIDKKNIGDEHPYYAARLNNLGVLYRAQGKYDLAEPLYLQAIEIDKNTIGETHPDYASHLNNLAGLYRAQGKYDLAEPLFLQAIEIDKKTIGEAHPDYASRLTNLAQLYDAQNEYDLAEPLFQQAIEIGKKTIGDEHPDYATHLNNLASFYNAQGEYELAEPLFLQAIEIGKKNIGEEHPSYAERLNNLAGLYYAQSKYDLAEPLFLQAIEIDKNALGDDHPQTIRHIANYEILKSKMP
jgi:tetratricopeptide (TPR) repeat protein